MKFAWIVLIKSSFEYIINEMGVNFVSTIKRVDKNVIKNMSINFPNWVLKTKQ